MNARALAIFDITDGRFDSFLSILELQLLPALHGDYFLLEMQRALPFIYASYMRLIIRGRYTAGQVTAHTCAGEATDTT